MTESTPTVVLASVWFAVACMPAGLLMRLDSGRWLLWRALWTVGAASFLVHTLSAYDLVYGWSHAVAIEETRRQTMATTGFDFGAGIYLNLLFALLWTADVVRAWRRPQGSRGRTTGTTLFIHGFFVFMVFNGTFVFVAGNRRWFGLVLSTALVGLLWIALQRHRRHQQGHA